MDFSKIFQKFGIVTDNTKYEKPKIGVDAFTSEKLKKKYIDNMEYHNNFDPYNPSTIKKDDYSGLMASVRVRGKKAIQEKKFNEAWKLFMEQKMYIMKLCAKRGCTQKEEISMDAEVSEDLANILRIEKRHLQALVHMTYCTLVDYPTVQYKSKKLKAYFNRAKLVNTSFEDFEKIAYELQANLDFKEVSDKIKELSEEY